MLSGSDENWDLKWSDMIVPVSLTGGYKELRLEFMSVTMDSNDNQLL